MTPAIERRTRDISAVLHGRARTSNHDDQTDAVTDILADIRHWCDAYAVDFDNCNRIAADHHQAEVADTP
ncbi:MAG: hypothetical protein KDA16_13135 [Phycisphaerales bacterium]|nr:hypothetical protein [Phycisphaerales bacterium]